MDAESLKALLRPQTLAALTVAPFLLQWLKATFPKAMTAEGAAIAAFVTATGLVLSQTWGQCAWSCMVLQCLYGWLYVELVYRHVVEPMANSSNPLVPPA